jgi:Fur family peroxide stress response transcriptional regulator
MGKIEDSEVERRLERFKAAAKDAGVKLTHQRLEVFRELASSREHPDAEELLRGVQARLPTVSLDTVYRTLWMLNDLGLICTLGPRRDSVRFDANTSPHHHCVCVKCGLVRDFESAALNALPMPPRVEGFGSVVGSHVEVRGICDDCAKLQPPNRWSEDDTQPQGTRRSKS